MVYKKRLSLNPEATRELKLKCQRRCSENQSPIIFSHAVRHSCLSPPFLLPYSIKCSTTCSRDRKYMCTLSSVRDKLSSPFGWRKKDGKRREERCQETVSIKCKVAVVERHALAEICTDGQKGVLVEQLLFLSKPLHKYQVLHSGVISPCHLHTVSHCRCDPDQISSAR